MKQLTIFPDPATLAKKVGQQLMEWIAQSQAPLFHLALSGGSTPNLLFQELVDRYADSEFWQKTHFWWVDERMVEPVDPESNYGTAKRLLLSKIKIPEGNIHRIRGEQEPSREVVTYASEIVEAVPMKGGWPRFDLILLGMGDDGHTASIFPGNLTLLESDHLCEVASHPVTFQQRITLTGKVLNHAGIVCFMVTGESKAERMSDILLNGANRSWLPASHIQPLDGELYWMADQGAAKLLT